MLMSNLAYELNKYKRENTVINYKMLDLLLSMVPITRLVNVAVI